jgi:hypothetical protein
MDMMGRHSMAKRSYACSSAFHYDILYGCIYCGQCIADARRSESCSRWHGLCWRSTFAYLFFGCMVSITAGYIPMARASDIIAAAGLVGTTVTGLARNMGANHANSTVPSDKRSDGMKLALIAYPANHRLEQAWQRALSYSQVELRHRRCSTLWLDELTQDIPIISGGYSH